MAKERELKWVKEATEEAEKAAEEETVETEEAIERFKKRDKQGRRLAMLVVTKHGDPAEPVLGVLTPYDVLE